MREVLMAEAYDPSEMGSLGKASLMLLRQWRFPHRYNEERGDYVTSADHDRINSWGDRWKLANDLIPMDGNWKVGIERFITQFPTAKVFEFVKTAMIDPKSDAPARDWYGFRILGTVRRDNGYPIYSLELFARGQTAKGNPTRTPTYSGPFAPNVKKPERNDRNPWRHYYG